MLTQDEHTCFTSLISDQREEKRDATFGQLHIVACTCSHTQTLFKQKHFMQEQECKEAKVVSHCFSMDMASSLNHILCRICQTRSYSPTIKIFMAVTAGFWPQCILFHSKKPRQEKKHTHLANVGMPHLVCVQSKKICFLPCVVQKHLIFSSLNDFRRQNI